MDIIYRINFSTRVCYIGKLDNTNILEAHSKGYYTGVHSYQSSGEKDGEKDVLVNGFKNQTYITSFSYWPVTEIKSRIVGKEISEEGFEALKAAGGKPDKETCEALCILLAKKDSVNVEQQIDFLSRGASGQEMVSEKEFNRRKKRQLEEYKLIQGLWLNFKNRKKPVVEEATDYVARMLERASGRRKGSLRVTYSKRLAEAITLKITSKTVKDLSDQLERRARDNPVGEQYIKDIEKQLKETAYKNGESGEVRNISYGTLFKALYKYIDANNAEQLEILNAAASSKKLSIMLKKGLDNTTLEDILPYENNNNFITDPFQLIAKRRFTDYIQTKCFEDRAPESGYVEGRNDWISQRTGTDGNPPKVVSRHKIHAGAIYPTFGKRLAGFQSGEVFYDFVYIEFPDSLYVKGGEKLDPKEDAFIGRNWSLIYPEQVAYCLTEHNAAFPEGEYEDGFITTIELENITYY